MKTLLHEKTQPSRGVLAPDEETILCCRCVERAYEHELPIPRAGGSLGFYCRECVGYRAEEVKRDRDIRHFVTAQRRSGVLEQDIMECDPAMALLLTSGRYNDNFWSLCNRTEALILAYRGEKRKIFLTAGIAAMKRARFWREDYADIFAEEREALKPAEEERLPVMFAGTQYCLPASVHSRLMDDLDGLEEFSIKAIGLICDALIAEGYDIPRFEAAA